jgi:predicted acylesterase/phospholipase RssA
MLQDLRLLRQKQRVMAYTQVCSWAIMTCFAWRDIPPRFHWLFLAMVGVCAYSRVADAGVFSLLDLVGWLSTFRLGNRKAPSGRSPFTRIPPDQPPQAGSMPRIGLVLAGGGGKGAYQIGCWKAMRNHGVVPDVVAGTSAGSLNVAMMVRGDLDAAEYIWSHLSASQLFRLDFASLPFIPLILLRYRRRYGVDAPGAKFFALLLLPLILAGWCWLLFRLAQMTLGIRSPAGQGGNYLALFMLALAAMMQIGSMVIHALSVFSPREDLFVQPSLFQTRGLRKLLRLLVPGGSFIQPPIDSFVTVAVESPMLDPEDPGHLTRGRTSLFGERHLSLVPRWVYQARYMLLSDLEKSEGIDWVHAFLMYSATIPIAFPVSRLLDAWIADGGLADNLPIKALLGRGCTRIFVVHLDSEAKDKIDGRSFNVLTKEGLLQKLRWQERLKRLEHYYPRVKDLVEQNGWGVLTSALSGDPKLDPNREMPLDAEIIHVIPSRPLGSFLTGTLNFTGRKARWLMRLGEQDMEEVLQELYRSGSQRLSL